MTTCSSDLITKGCMCLSNPIAPESQVCAYINRQSGLVTPCDPGCCVPACLMSANAPNILQVQNELRPSAGTGLPVGFGSNLPISNLPSEMQSTPRFSGATSFTPPVDVNESVWQRMLVPLLMLVIVLLASIALA